MNTNEFLQRLRLLDLTRQQYADLTGVAIRTVYHWISTDSVPKWNSLVLDALEYNNRIA